MVIFRISRSIYVSGYMKAKTCSGCWYWNSPRVSRQTWWSTTFALPVQKPPTEAREWPIADVIMSIFSTCHGPIAHLRNASSILALVWSLRRIVLQYWVNLQSMVHKQRIVTRWVQWCTGILKCSESPRPVLPRTPMELLSSTRTLKRYFSFNRTTVSKGTISPEFCSQKPNLTHAVCL